MNRGKYSEPEDVLIPSFERWGIASFQVRDIPRELVSGGGLKFEYRVAHIPKEDNYAHSEVRAHKNGKYDPGMKVSLTVKKQFRQLLSDRAVLVKPAEI